MQGQNRKLAAALLEHHPGIPDKDVALELVESMIIVMKNFVINEKELRLDGVGSIVIKKIAGGRKRDGRTGIIYDVTSRNVIKFNPSEGLKRIANMDRKPSKKVAKSEMPNMQ